MEKFNLRKFKEYKDKSYIEIRYEGLLTEVSNVDKVNNLIETFLNNGTHNDMLKNVRYIRTILDTFIEESLIIEYSDYLGDNFEIVEYKNGVLTSYKYQNFDGTLKMEAKFLLGKEFSTTISGEKYDFIELSNIEKSKEFSSKVIDQISALRNIKGLSLANDEKKIIEIYKLFYNDNPDFTKKDINLKIQAMVLILCQFNLFSGYQFSIQNELIESLQLTALTNKLFPLGEVTDLKDSIELNERSKNIIKIVGDTIRERVGNEDNLNETLLSISRTIYAANFDINSLSETKKLVEYPNLNLTYNEVDNNIRLVNTIQGKIDSIKF